MTPGKRSGRFSSLFRSHCSPRLAERRRRVLGSFFEKLEDRRLLVAEIWEPSFNGSFSVLPPLDTPVAFLGSTDSQLDTDMAIFTAEAGDRISLSMSARDVAFRSFDPAYSFFQVAVDARDDYISFPEPNYDVDVVSGSTSGSYTANAEVSSQLAGASASAELSFQAAGNTLALDFELTVARHNDNKLFTVFVGGSAGFAFEPYGGFSKTQAPALTEPGVYYGVSTLDTTFFVPVGGTPESDARYDAERSSLSGLMQVGGGQPIPPFRAEAIYVSGFGHESRLSEGVVTDGYATDTPVVSGHAQWIAPTAVADFAVIDAAGTVLSAFSSGARNFVVPASGSYRLIVQNGHGHLGLSNYRIDITSDTDIPPSAIGADISATEDGPAVTTGILADDADNSDDPGSLVYTIVTTPSEGSVVSNGDGTFTFDPEGGFQDLRPGETRVVSFTFKATDSHGAESNEGAVTVTVNGVNDAPVAQDQSLATAEDTVLSITLSASDVDGDALTFAVETPPAHGVLGGSGDALVYTPNANYFGGDQFTYTVSDGSGGSATAIITLTVTDVNDAPVALDDGITVADNSSMNVIDVLANDTDAVGDMLSIISVGPATRGFTSTNGSQAIYSPFPGFVGADSFTYTISDGKGGTDTARVSVTVAYVNDPPGFAGIPISVATEDAPYAYTFSTFDPDPGSTNLTVTAVTLPSWLTLTTPFASPPFFSLNGTGRLSGVPTNADVGVHNVVLMVTDTFGLAATQSFTITVANVNDAPVAEDQSLVTVEDIVLAITLAASDVDGDVLTFAVETPPANGVLSASGANLLYTPNADFFGSDEFIYTVSDGNGGIDTATVSITVTPDNEQVVGTPGGGTVTIVSAAGTSIHDVAAIPNPSPANAPANVDFPIGFFSFEVRGVSPGGATSIEIVLPADLEINSYYKFGATANNPSPHWYEFLWDGATGTTGAEMIDVNGVPGVERIILHFVDGQTGDHDLSVNGVIVDPGAPASVESTEPVIENVTIDFKPGDNSNVLNLNSNGMLAVAIFGTTEFNAARIDVSTVIYAGAHAARGVLQDINGDGRLDMLLHFRTQDTELRAIYEQLLTEGLDDGILDASRQTANVSLSGQTLDDILFEGSDQMTLFLAGRELREMLEALAESGAPV